MKVNKRLLTVCIAIPLLVGITAGFLTRNSMAVFESAAKPPLSPPAWLFPIVWTILYTLMGISSYIVVTSNAPKSKIENTIRIYVIQLIVNFLWPFFFFQLGWYEFSFLWLLLLWLLVFLMIWKFNEISKISAYLNLLYLLWLTFAAYLNYGIWRLNL